MFRLFVHFGRTSNVRPFFASWLALAELKGISATIPNESILISTLSLQEALDSSAVENIVTTQEELFQRDSRAEVFASPAAREVLYYAQSLQAGFGCVFAKPLCSPKTISSKFRRVSRKHGGLSSSSRHDAQK